MMRMPYFPEPYPDELLWSTYSRLHVHCGHRSAIQTSQDLFGIRGLGHLPIFPTRLELLLTRLPQSSRYTLDELIQEHSLFPFYAHFWSEEKQERIRKHMCGSMDKTPFRMYAGLLRPIALAKRLLLYCDKCVEADREKFGEAYWHCTHQFPGVYHCTTHKGQRLLESTVPLQSRSSYKEYVALDGIIQTTDRSPIENLSKKSEEILVKVAQDVRYLSTLPPNYRGNGWFRIRMLAMLRQNNWLCEGTSNMLRASEIRLKIAKELPQDLLSLLDCDFDFERKKPWPFTALQPAPNDSVHPLRYILMVQVFGQSLQEVFTLEPHTSVNVEKFGKGSWKCLNKASEHFGQDVITEKPSMKPYQNAGCNDPIYTYTCECGYSYTCRASQIPEKHARVVMYGRVWEEKLREMATQANITQKQAADKLGVSIGTLLKYATKLGIEKFTKHWVQEIQLNERYYRDTIIHQRRESKRKLFSATLDVYPTLKRYQIQQKIGNAYAWLMKWDRDWITERLPSIEVSRLGAPKVDFTTRDRLLAEQVPKVAEQLKKTGGVGQKFGM